MARNLSVEQFKQLMTRIAPAAADELRSAVFDQANALSNAQRSAAHVADGAYRDSHRVEPGRHPLQARVLAGGSLTTKNGYDYANANEFGTEKMNARPSFWPTYRLMKRRIRSAISRRANKAIRKIVPLT